MDVRSTDVICPWLTSSKILTNQLIQICWSKIYSCVNFISGFPAEHGKIFIGIIVHHRITRAVPAVGRGIFDIPVATATATTDRHHHHHQPKLSPYPSPETPDTASGTSPTPSHSAAATTHHHSTGSHRPTKQRHDPIVSQFLAMEGAPPARVTEADSPDTSEPMDIDDDSTKGEELIAKAAEKLPVSVPDLLKLVSKLPTTTQAALGLTKKAAAAPPPPVDPRLARLNPPAQPAVATAEPESTLPAAAAASVKTQPIQINLAMTKSRPVAPLTVETQEVPAPTVASTQPVKTDLVMAPVAADEDIGASFGFSKKFIENLAKIEFPAGLKEALRSIAPSTSSAAATLLPQPEPPVQPVKPSLLGLPPNYSTPPPAFTPNYSVPPPGLGGGGIRPPNFAPVTGGAPPAHFSAHIPPPGYRDGPLLPPPQGFNGDRNLPPRGGGFAGDASSSQPRWHAPPPSQQQRHPFNPPGPGNRYSPSMEPSPRHFLATAPLENSSRWGDRSTGVDRREEMGCGNRRGGHSPPRLDRRGDLDRGRDRRDDRRRSGDERRRSEERVEGRLGGRPPRRSPSPPRRRRSRSRSPDRRPRRSTRDRDTSGGGSRRGRGNDAGGGAASATTGNGVDEFGRDMSLRRQVSTTKSNSRDRDSRSLEKSGHRERRDSRSQEKPFGGSATHDVDLPKNGGESGDGDGKTGEKIAPDTESSQQ